MDRFGELLAGLSNFYNPEKQSGKVKNTVRRRSGMCRIMTSAEKSLAMNT